MYRKKKSNIVINYPSKCIYTFQKASKRIVFPFQRLFYQHKNGAHTAVCDLHILQGERSIFENLDILSSPGRPPPQIQTLYVTTQIPPTTQSFSLAGKLRTLAKPLDAQCQSKVHSRTVAEPDVAIELEFNTAETHDEHLEKLRNVLKTQPVAQSTKDAKNKF